MTPNKPILVMLSYRGGERLQRCLESIEASHHHFSRVILSVTAPHDSDDMRRCVAFRDERLPRAEVICTGVELPTMRHQRFWIDYLDANGAMPDDWIYWLAYDDQVRVSGIDALVDGAGSWPLRTDTAYFGPWALRHEQPDHLFDGPWDADLESWTSFPLDGPLRLPVEQWIGRQLVQPTYMQMSGSVVPLANHRRLVHEKPLKQGPMRIEMATVAQPNTRYVEEFAEPVSIIYGRSNSDRASYGKAARQEDRHLAALLSRYAVAHPQAVPTLASAGLRVGANYARVATRTGDLPQEQWVVRGTVRP